MAEANKYPVPAPATPKAEINLVSIGNHASDNAITLINLVSRLRELRRNMDGSSPAVESVCAGVKAVEVVGLLAIVNDANQNISGNLSDLEYEIELLTALL